ncbi:MAG TPA: hypothetical protein VIT92_10460, partial [Burkholderiaceae bacterium]
MTDPSHQLSAAAVLLQHLNWDDAEQAREMVVRFNHVADNPGIAPVYRLAWWRAAIYRVQFDSDIELADRIVDNAKQLTGEFHLMHFRFPFDYRLGANALSKRDLVKAKQVLDTLNAAASGTSKVEKAYLRIFEARYFSQLGEAKDARRAAEEAAAYGESAGLPAVVWCHLYILLACCCAQDLDGASAEAYAAKAVANAYGEDGAFARKTQLFVAAFL